MINKLWLLVGLTCIAALPASAQSFRVQCPTSTITHPNLTVDPVTGKDTEPAYTAPTTFVSTNTTTPAAGYLVPSANVNGTIKCQQVSGGDGYSTMANGTQTFMFSFGPLSGLAKIANGQAGTDYPDEFNVVYTDQPQIFPGDPATTDGASDSGTGYTPWTGFPLAFNPSFSYNGAVGLAPDADCIAGNNAALATVPPAPLPCPAVPMSGPYKGLDGHVDPRQIVDVGMMNGNIPAPLVAFDEDDEMFLGLTNVGMIMRPDLFEQHTIHFHGYPNASSVYDGVPDASVAINIGGTFTYYYFAPDAGTYFWHCHITPPEHLQMGMVGQLYVRPRQNRVPSGVNLYASLQQQFLDLRTICSPNYDILCANSLPAGGSPTAGATRVAAKTLCDGVTSAPSITLANYAYNDGDGASCYELEYPLQIHGFDPNFHFVGMTFNPEMFVDMKDKFFLLNGRSYPDTTTPGPLGSMSSDGVWHYSQPMPAIINVPVGGRTLLRIADLDVSEYQTLTSLGIPMKEIGFNAKLLRDQAGNNQAFYTNSITLGGGESLDVFLDATDGGCGSAGCAKALYAPGSVFYLFTPNLDHLSNDQENFGGLMTEVHVCDPTLAVGAVNACN
jgi:FtsP/CotA-like multicopper oxidase with cupredoxin domain